MFTQNWKIYSFFLSWAECILSLKGTPINLYKHNVVLVYTSFFNLNRVHPSTNKLFKPSNSIYRTNLDQMSALSLSIVTHGWLLSVEKCIQPVQIVILDCYIVHIEIMTTVVFTLGNITYFEPRKKFRRGNKERRKKL